LKRAGGGRVPKLPDLYAALLPQPDDNFVFEAHLIEIPTIPNYDPLRAIPESSLICPDTLVPDGAVRNAEFSRIIYE